jgi:hypothetical protein
MIEHPIIFTFSTVLDFHQNSVAGACYEHGKHDHVQWKTFHLSLVVVHSLSEID